MITTSVEDALAEVEQAELAAQREHRRAEALAARLRSLGIDTDVD